MGRRYVSEEGQPHGSAPSLTLPSEEIPREGIIVRTVAALALRADGSYARWTGHRIRIGHGEGSSGYLTDSVVLPRRSTP
jgi:hypothetical protein